MKHIGNKRRGKIKYIAFILSVLFACAPLASCAGKKADGTVYKDSYMYENAVFFGLHENLMTAYINEEGTPARHTCADPFCTHTDSRCAEYTNNTSHTLIVPNGEGKMPTVYMFARRYILEYIDDDKVLRTSAEEINLGMTKVFDLETGKAKVLAKNDFSRVTGAWYCDGKIYLSVEYLASGGRVGMMDAETGEYSDLDTGKDYASGLGISGGRFYYITDRGVIFSTDLSLGDVREEYDVGVSTKRNNSFFLKGYAEDGMLYFERNCRILEGMEEHPLGKNVMVSDVYALRLDDMEAGETLVAKGAAQFMAHGGSLYYTVGEYRGLGELMSGDGYTRQIMTTDGGTLYRYDKDTGESSVCYEDSGMCIFEMYELTDDYVVYWGSQYRDLENYDIGSVENTKYFHHYLCVSDLKTGEWRVIRHSSSPDVSEGGML